MSTPAAEFYRIERATASEPKGRRSPVARALGTALTGLPMPRSKLTWETTLRILDDSGTVVYETLADAKTIDALELQVLQDLIRLDVEAFRQSYGLPET
jgi:hypothetical protein